MEIEKKPSRLITKGFFALLSALLIFSCSSKPDLASHIPKDANVVLAFDVKSMGLKSLDFSEILSLDNLKKAFGSTSKDTAANYFKDSGVDFLNKAYFFMKTTDSGQYGGAIAALSDAQKFEEFIKKSDADFVITEEGNFKLAGIPEGKGFIAWNKSELIVLFGGENPKETVLSLANLKKEESLVSNSDTFKDLQNESADISCWVSFENLQKLVPQYGVPAGTMNLKETFLTATCNFEDGQVVINSKYATNNEVAKTLAFVKESVSADVANALPGESVIGMMGFAFDMEKVYTYLEEQKLLEVYGASASQMTGLTVKDFLTMLSGDFAVTVNGMKMAEVESMNWSTGQVEVKKEPQPEYCAVIGVADREKMSQLLAHFTESGMLAKKDNYYAVQDKIFILEQGTSLIITGTEAVKQMVLDGSGENLNKELVTMLTSNATSFYLNLNNIPENTYTEGNSSMGNGIKNSEVEDITFTGSTVRDNVSTGKIVIRFREKDENSLITISRVSKKYAEWVNPPAVAASVDSEEPVATPN